MAGRSGAKKGSVDVVPALVDTHEAAALVQPVGAATDTVAGDELDLGAVGGAAYMVPDLQADPAYRRLIG